MTSPDERPVFQPDAVLEALQNFPEPHCLNHKMLLEGLFLQKEVVLMFKNGLRGENDGLKVLAKYLRSLYCSVSALPKSIRYNQLELSIIKSGILEPFISDMDLSTKRLEIGLPSKPDVLCDTLYEMLVICVAAFCLYWHYMNFPHSEDSYPSDDAALLLSTIAIRSLAEESVCQSIDAELSVLGIESFTSKEMKWFLHWLRSELTGAFAAVQYILESEKTQDSLVAQQQDRLAMIKQVPNNVLGYLLYARSCLQFQQHRPAHLFAQKALIVAEKDNEVIARPQLMCIKALSAVLGGSKPTFSPKEAGSALPAARQLLKEVTTWLPAPYHDLLTLAPEDDAISSYVLGLEKPAAEEGAEEVVQEAPAYEARLEEDEAVPGLSEEEIPAREALYTTPAPKEMPIGALTRLAARPQPETVAEE